MSGEKASLVKVTMNKNGDAGMDIMSVHRELECLGWNKEDETATGKGRPSRLRTQALTLERPI